MTSLLFIFTFFIYLFILFYFFIFYFLFYFYFFFIHFFCVSGGGGGSRAISNPIHIKRKRFSATSLCQFMLQYISCIEFLLFISYLFISVRKSQNQLIRTLAPPKLIKKKESEWNNKQQEILGFGFYENNSSKTSFGFSWRNPGSCSLISFPQ